MNDENENNSINPFGPFIKLTDFWLNAAGDALSRTTAGRPFAEAMGAQMDFTLEMTRLLRQQTNSVVEFTMQQMGFPTGDQVVNLAERLNHLEMRLDDIEAKVDETLDLLKATVEQE